MYEYMTTTYSMWSQFRNCRRACQLRYLENLVSLNKNKNLYFGSIIHRCLEIWHRDRDLEKVFEFINTTYPGRSQNRDQRRDWHLSTALMRGYVNRYPQEEFQVIELEKKFEGKIINPSTGFSSRSFKLSGKVDGIVKIENAYWLLEHKTAAQIDGSYLEKLWTDFQIILYSWYVRETLGIPVVGIIYNILVKAKLQQSKGETETEFEDRRQQLIAKSKTGKTSAKRKMPETDESFQERLAVKYAETEMFHRETIYISRDRYDDLRAELWKLTQSFLEARRLNNFYRNTGFCFHFNRPCFYYPICSSSDNPIVIENQYKEVAPHEELRESEATELAF
jgi:hypothetical protein